MNHSHLCRRSCKCYWTCRDMFKMFIILIKNDLLLEAGINQTYGLFFLPLVPGLWPHVANDSFSVWTRVMVFWKEFRYFTVCQLTVVFFPRCAGRAALRLQMMRARRLCYAVESEQPADSERKNDTEFHLRQHILLHLRHGTECVWSSTVLTAVTQCPKQNQNISNILQKEGGGRQVPFMNDWTGCF